MSFEMHRSAERSGPVHGKRAELLSLKRRVLPPFARLL
jgi:hypothetical protein